MERAQPALVLINYKNPADTLRCLESLEVSSGGDADIFLVDNETTPETLGALRAFEERTPLRLRLIPIRENTGFAGGVNAGLRAVREGGFTHAVILNNDTEVDRGFWKAVMDAASLHPDSVVAGTVLDHSTGEPSFNVGTIRAGTLRVRHNLNFKPGETLEGLEFVSGCLLVLPLSVLDSVGFFDERYFMYGEDFEYSIRLGRKGVRIVHVPEIVVRHAVSSGALRTGLAKEYYLTRNQVYIVKSLGSPLQKIGFAGFLLLSLASKVAKPSILIQRARGVLDAFASRMGRR